jgi:hypothetical protein
MDPTIQKLINSLPKITNQHNIPADVQKSLSSALKNMTDVQASIKQQQDRLKRALEVERDYERSIDAAEKIHNQAGDIGGPVSQ